MSHRLYIIINFIMTTVRSITINDKIQKTNQNIINEVSK